MGKELSAEIVIESIEKHRGIIAVAARALGSSRRTLYNYIEKYPTVKKAYEDANEATIDFVEGKLLDRINKGDTTAMIFFLKTKAKKRGYVEKVETEQSGDLTIRVIYDDSLPGDK
jgi:hypothetical protein